jgi:tetratricopeptide (TPR) repeat protein
MAAPNESPITAPPTSSVRRPQARRVIAAGALGVLVIGAALWARARLWVPDETTMGSLPLADLLSLARRHPDSEPVYYTLGLRLKAEGRYYEAVTALDQAMTDDPHSARSLEAQGQVFAQAHQPAEAVQCFEWSLRLDSARLGTRRMLAVLYQQEREWARAAQQLQAISRARPDEAETWARLGTCLLALRRCTDAVNAFSRASELDPANDGYREALRRARVLRFEEAVK